MSSESSDPNPIPPRRPVREIGVDDLLRQIAAAEVEERVAALRAAVTAATRPAVVEMQSLVEKTSAAEDAMASVYQHTLEAAKRIMVGAANGQGANERDSALPPGVQQMVDATTSQYVSRLLKVANDTAEEIVQLSHNGESAGQASESLRQDPPPGAKGAGGWGYLPVQPALVFIGLLAVLDWFNWIDVGAWITYLQEVIRAVAPVAGS